MSEPLTAEEIALESAIEGHSHVGAPPERRISCDRGHVGGCAPAILADLRAQHGMTLATLDAARPSGDVSEPLTADEIEEIRRSVTPVTDLEARLLATLDAARDPGLDEYVLAEDVTVMERDGAWGELAKGTSVYVEAEAQQREGAG